MNEDPIVAEVRKLRDEYARQFDYDLDSILEDLKAKEKESGHDLVSRPPKAQPVNQQGVA